MKKKIILFGFLGFILIFVGTTGYQFFKERDRKSEGVIVKINSKSIPFDLEKNYYVADSFPNAKKQEGNGKLISTGINAIVNTINDLGGKFSFRYTDSMFYALNGYRKDNLNWKKIEQIFIGYSYYQVRDINSGIILKSLNSGRTPIVLLKDKHGNFLYKRIKGINWNNLLVPFELSQVDFEDRVADPKFPMDIKRFDGGKIYGLWIIYPTKYRDLDRTR